MVIINNTFKDFRRGLPEINNLVEIHISGKINVVLVWFFKHRLTVYYEDSIIKIYSMEKSVVRYIKTSTQCFFC